LGYGEFCSVDAGILTGRGVSFCLRLKKNHCVEIENLIWQRLDQLGVVAGTSLYFCMSDGQKNTGLYSGLIWLVNGKETIKD
jgi:glucan biosynthesis protein